MNILSNDSLVGILGASLLKENNEFENKTIISSGRLPSDLETIVNLKSQLVLGLNGFHDKTLNNFQKLGINTIFVSIINFNDLEKLFSKIKTLLGIKNELNISDIIPACYDSNKKINLSNK